MAEALSFAAEGKVKADIELRALSSINEIFERLQHGDVPSRVVLEFEGIPGEKRAVPDGKRTSDVVNATGAVLDGRTGRA
jgi:hypothetical protein